MQSPNDWKNVEITAYLKLDNQGGYITGASGSVLGGIIPCMQEEEDT